jgi:hypothetical protein
MKLKQYRVKCGLLYTTILARHLKYMFEHDNKLNVNTLPTNVIAGGKLSDSACRLLSRWYLAQLFDSEDGGDMFLTNVG